MIALPILAYAALFHPTATLANGKVCTMRGKGAPVVFSPGMFGVSTWRLYSSFLNRLRERVTVVTIPGPVTAEDVSQVTEAIGAESVGFVAHSSFDPAILTQPQVARAVVCDPVSLPFSGATTTSCPTLVVHAGLFRTDDRVPSWNRMSIVGSTTEEWVVEDVGHTDILDDRWADLGRRSGIWRALRGPKTTFEEWAAPSKTNIQKLRGDYRRSVADRAAGFLAPPSPSPPPDSVDAATQRDHPAL